jgi:hypothetical protein
MKFKHLFLSFALAAASLAAMNNVAQAEDAAPVSAPATEAAPVPEAAAEENEFKMFRFSLRMERLDFVKQAMMLSEEQEKKFLSQYYNYDTELKFLNDKRVEVIKDYAANFEKITDKKADELVKRSFAFRKQRNALLEKYYAKIAKVTSKVVAARFLQMESVLQGAGDVAIGSEIPLMAK